jgi:peptidyl-prolyl cis-trans isomerase SurA
MNNKKLIIIVALLLSCIAQSPALLSQSDSILLDKIAAVVNEEIITLIDIDKAIQFYPILRKKGESDNQFYTNVLEDLINHKIIYLEHRNDFQLKEEDYVQVQSEAIEKMGSLDEFMRLLKSFDMEWLDFKDFVREKVVFEKILAQQLQVNISVNFNEIESFYQQEYLPLQQQMGLTPRSLIDMSSQIENHLRKIRTREELAGWLKEIRTSYQIKNKMNK